MQALLQRGQESREKVDQYPLSRLEALAQMVLHKGAEYDRTDALLLGPFRDEAQRIINLVKGIEKWQSHEVEIMALELRKQTMAKGFRGNSGLVRNKKYCTTTHNKKRHRVTMAG